MPLKDSEIIDRLDYSKTFMERYIRLDKQACRRYLDASTLPIWTEDDGENEMDSTSIGVDDTPIGQPNQMTANLLIKKAANTVNNPDWYVVADEGEIPPEEVVQISRQYLVGVSERDDWPRVSGLAYLKASMSGLGFVSYRWDEKKGPVFEHTQVWDLAIDPNVSDWNNIEWAFRRVKMPLRKLIERYGERPFQTIHVDSSKAGLDRNRYDIWVYWDMDSRQECHIYDGKIIFKGENLYDEVPILALSKDDDPGPSPFPVGDHVLASGLQAELSDINLYISNMAKHGGPINLYDPSLIPADQIEIGKQQGFIPVQQYDANNPPILRIGSEQLHAAVLEAKLEAKNALSDMTGVTPMMLGRSLPRATSATEVVAIESNSGARAREEQDKFERFMNRWARRAVKLTVAFGGPSQELIRRAEAEAIDIQVMPEVILWNALQQIREVKIVQGSTQYKDPQVQQQQTMQLFTLIAQNYPLLIQLHSAGLIDALPNLKNLIDEIYRSFGRSNTEKYWVAVPPPDPMMEGQDEGRPDSSSVPKGA